VERRGFLEGIKRRKRDALLERLGATDFEILFCMIGGFPLVKKKGAE